MNTIEEQLWNYIDDNSTAVEKAEIEAKLAVNLQYHTIYQELLAVHNELNQLDFEEPSMSFTRNVMEQVNVELRPVALKTKVDNRIIYSIGAFFVLSLVCIFGYVIATSDLSLSFDTSKFDFSFDITKAVNPTTLKIFLFVDIILGMVYLDSFLRKRKGIKQKEV